MKKTVIKLEKQIKSGGKTTRKKLNNETELLLIVNVETV